MTDSPRRLSRFEARRQRRIQRRRKEILAAAARVFAAKGYANTTTREIALAADLAEGTLYNYFDGKRAILLTIVGDVMNDLAEMMETVGSLQHREDMVDFVEGIFDAFSEKLPFTRTLIIEAWLDDEIFKEFFAVRLAEIAAQIEAFIGDRVAAGTFRPIDPRLATRMLLGMFIAPIVPVLRGIEPPPTPAERRRFTETAVDVLMHGICIPEKE
ncbi:MAG: TetR/AcrR family transcriptional regulator [Anaerolineae bacterium]